MKKTVSAVLAAVLSVSLAAPALAVGTEYDDGDQRIIGTTANGVEDVRAMVPGAAQGVAPFGATDASMTFTPSPDTIPGATDIYYEVHEFDTLAGIAFAFYGNSNLANALYEANKNGHFLISGGVLESQRPLRIPTKLAGVDRLDIANPLKIGDVNGDDVVSQAEYDNVMRNANVRVGDYGNTEVTWDEFYWNFYPVTHFAYTILWNSIAGVRLDGASTGPSYTWTAGGPLDVNSVLFWAWDDTTGALVAPGVADQQNGAWNEEQVFERCGQIVYIVRKGDTLDSIAKTFYSGMGVNTYYTNNAQHLINAIKAANVGRINGDNLAVGQYIILPVVTIGY